uniref:Uncharacterized protein n=1 Tax=Rhizophora mucronata TaxID=61149 RepID=A0A2P2R3I4_RHIMU
MRNLISAIDLHKRYKCFSAEFPCPLWN